VRVSSQGNINYPLLGSVQVGGLTVSETETKLKEQLGRNFLVNPQVNVLIDRANSRRVFVLGQAKAPGAIEIQADEGLTVVQAIARAGGFTDIAATDRVNILRTGQDGTQLKIVVNVAAIIKGQSKDFPLKPDDVVSVPETIF
jgi:polysaccharide export outer membrane protein